MVCSYDSIKGGFCFKKLRNIRHFLPTMTFLSPRRYGHNGHLSSRVQSRRSFALPPEHIRQFFLIASHNFFLLTLALGTVHLPPVHELTLGYLYEIVVEVAVSLNVSNIETYHPFVRHTLVPVCISIA